VVLMVYLLGLDHFPISRSPYNIRSQKISIISDMRQAIDSDMNHSSLSISCGAKFRIFFVNCSYHGFVRNTTPDNRVSYG
jgi:hypothetical protein